MTMRRTLVGVVSVVAVAVALVAAFPASAAFPGTNGRLAFSRNGNVFTIDPDGTDPARITGTGNDWGPTWSPDGGSIAFVRCTDLCAIWVMDQDGTDAHRVSARGWVQPPLWSPDGTAIAYTVLRDEEHRAIVVVTPDGSTRTRLTTYRYSRSVTGWSPDATKLLFVSDQDGDPDLWVMDRDGSDATKLTRNVVMDLDGAFSPDGTRIAFYRASRQGRTTSIWTMASDGTDERQVTSFGPGVRGFDLRPIWSPDGRWIAFRRDLMPRTGTTVQIFRVALDGSGLRALTGTRGHVFDWAWSPDSSRVAYVDIDPMTERSRAIEVVGADGSGRRVVLSGSGLGSLDWQARS